MHFLDSKTLHQDCNIGQPFFLSFVLHHNYAQVVNVCCWRWMGRMFRNLRASLDIFPSIVEHTFC